MSQSLNTILNLAYIYLNYGKTKRAIDYLIIANRIQPNHLQVLKMQVSAFKDIGAYDQALLLIDKILARDDLSDLDQITTILFKSLCLKGMKDDDGAKTYFNEYIAQRKQHARKVNIQKRQKMMGNEYNMDDDVEHFIKRKAG